MWPWIKRKHSGFVKIIKKGVRENGEKISVYDRPYINYLTLTI